MDFSETFILAETGHAILTAPTPPYFPAFPFALNFNSSADLHNGGLSPHASIPHVICNAKLVGKEDGDAALEGLLQLRIIPQGARQASDQNLGYETRYQITQSKGTL